MKKESFLRKITSGMVFILLIVSVVMLQIPGTAEAQEDTATNDINRDTSVLDGKVMKYEYFQSVLVEAKSSGDEKPKPISKNPPGIWCPESLTRVTELRFGHLACTWTGIMGEATWGPTGTQPCIQVEIEPGIYQVLWMEPNADTVTMSINLKTKRVLTSYRHDPGPILELLEARILEFGPASEMGYGN